MTWDLLGKIVWYTIVIIFVAIGVTALLASATGRL